MKSGRPTVAPKRPWADKDVARVLSGTCGWKDGDYHSNSREWQEALANFIVAAAGMKGAPVPLASARRQLIRLATAVAS
jgi:hypothetical protein